jgi:hypothetical protein
MEERIVADLHALTPQCLAKTNLMGFATLERKRHLVR